MSSGVRPGRPGGRRAPLTGGLALAALVSLSSGALAQLGPNGSRIRTNDYAIDLFQGPVIASTRVTGLGGAYVAVAEFTEGTSQNPAAPAVRAAYSYDHIDYDIGLGVTFASTLTRSDFFNTGKGDTVIPSTDERGFFAGEISANLQFGRWGVGASLKAQTYALTRAEDDSDELESRFANPDINLARSFFDGQLVLGAGARGAGLSVVNTSPRAGSDAMLLESIGATLQVGGLWRPNDTSYRIGAALRGPIRTETDGTSKQVLFADTPDELYLPTSVEVPWELAAGFAYQFGKLFNPRWYDPTVLVERTERYVQWRKADRERRRKRLHRTAERAGGDVKAARQAIDAQLRAEETTDEASLTRARAETRERLVERYQDLGRFYLLVSTAVIVNGPTPDAVGVESFLERVVNRSGEEVTLSPRLGVETELWPRWFVFRAGTYLEPTRFKSNPDGARWHGTAGGDLRLGGWNVFGVWPEEYIWRLRGAIDVSRRYLGWAVAIGGWY